MIPSLTYFCSRNTGGNRAGFVFREVDEPRLNRSDLAGQLGRIRDLEEGGELGGFLRGEDPGIDDALVGRARLVIDPRLLAVLVRPPVDSFRCRGEQVQPHPHQRIQLVQQLLLECGVVAVMKRVSAHHVTILLLHVSVVVSPDHQAWALRGVLRGRPACQEFPEGQCETSLAQFGIAPPAIPSLGGVRPILVSLHKHLVWLHGLPELSLEPTRAGFASSRGHDYARRPTRIQKHWFPTTRSGHKRCTGRPSAVIR